MRHVKVTLGIAAVVVCAFGAITSPAFAKEKKAPVFGKFTASIFGRSISAAEPATATGTGEIDEMSLAGGALFINECGKEAKSSGKVVSESAETFFQNVKFSKCFAKVKLGNSGLTSRMKIPSFTLGMEFHSNHAAVIGEAEENNLEIVRPSSVAVKIGKTTCTVVIPAQTIPVKAEKKPEKLFEAAGYETEEEAVTKRKELSKFPSGFQQKLDIEWEFKKLMSAVKPNENCKYPETGSKFVSNPESPNFGMVVYNEGSFEGELEEITIKNGNVGFKPSPKEEAE
jgi:hypothetical protein